MWEVQMGRSSTRVVRNAAWAFATFGLFGLALIWCPRVARSQSNPQDHAKHAAVAKATGGEDVLSDQVRQLKDKLTKLEAALSQGHAVGPSGAMGLGPMPSTGAIKGDAGPREGVRVAARFQDCTRCHQSRPAGPLPASHLEASSGMGMGTTAQGAGMPMMGVGKMEGGAAGMGMTDDVMGQGGMGSGQKVGPMDDDEMMGMGAMGKAKSRGMVKMRMSSSLPGFPGASHLYHIGAEGFFLNHDVHISLTADQHQKLERIKEKAMLDGASCGRNIDKAEQDLWELTASDTPDAAAIEGKLREVEKLRGDQRLAFIRAVGEAASQLTEEQRHVLVGANHTAKSEH
jgi:Spy/CpxP family protein refolding chaperone